MSEKNWREDPDSYIVEDASGVIVGLGSALRKDYNIPADFKPGEVARQSNGRLLYVSQKDFKAAPDTDEGVEVQSRAVESEEELPEKLDDIIGRNTRKGGV